MPSIIDHETIHVDELHPLWAPVQWDLTDEERIHIQEEQTKANLLWMMDTPEAILRLLLDEVETKRLYEPPEGYNEEEQGEWEPELVTFGPRHPFELDSVSREGDALFIVYKAGDLGYWEFEITEEQVIIKRI